MTEASVRDDAPPEKLPLRLRRMRLLKKAAQEVEKRREEQLEWSRRSHEREGTLQRAEALFEAKRKEEQAAQRVARGQERRKKKSRYASFKDTPNSEACT